MPNKDIIAEIGRYIDQYYQPPRNDDIKLDPEMQTIFDRITNFREKRTCEMVRESPAKYHAKQVRKEPEKTQPSAASRRTIDHLLGQMEETFSQRLLRMIDEKALKDSDVYTKAGIDRRHFSKIKNNEAYSPSKKTVLAFAIALELSLDEAKDLLQSAGYALSRSSKTDVIMAYFLQNRIYDWLEINDVLYAYGQPMFE